MTTHLALTKDPPQKKRPSFNVIAICQGHAPGLAFSPAMTLDELTLTCPHGAPESEPNVKCLCQLSKKQISGHIVKVILPSLKVDFSTMQII